MKFSTKARGNGSGLRQETMHYFWHSGLLGSVELSSVRVSCRFFVE
ncbi:protein of unknown function [Xenorhabdus nematophila AN6/1]|nr:protein of unknown function [Xenorhabdus nematophila AN6/1]